MSFYDTCKLPILFAVLLLQHLLLWMEHVQIGPEVGVTDYL